jgi:hypothetical protein
MELKKLEVSELQFSEKQTINGGGLLLVLGLYLLYETAGNPTESWEAFKKGWNYGPY